MAGRHEKIHDLERIGSQIGGLPLNEASNQIPFEHKTKRIRQEDHNLTSRLPDTARPTRPLDPIQRLPPEISTFIIQHTLPQDGTYSPRLLDLTAVSQIWLNFLVTTPVLWSKIYLDDREPDSLATVATFVHLSGQVALKVAIYDRPMNGWAGLLSILAPVHQRIASLTVLETKFRGVYDSEGISGIISAIRTFFDDLGPLPQLQELAFVDAAMPTISVFDSLDLPPAIRLSGTLYVRMPPSAQSSATPGRSFDIKKYTSFGPSPLVAPLFRSCTLSLEWHFHTCVTNVQMTGEVLSHLKLSSKYIHERIFPSAATNSLNSSTNPAPITTKSTVDAAPADYGLERFTHIIGTSVCHLDITVSVSQVDELVNFLQLLIRLEILTLQMVVSKTEGTAKIAPGSIVVPHLRRLSITFINQSGLPLQTAAQALRGLFSVLTPLYPGVESLLISIDICPFFASSYMESLRRLKYLGLSPGSDLDDTQYDGENDSITLHSLEQLVVEGKPLIHHLRTPNLLSLTLYEIASSADIKNLGISSLRKLTIHQGEGLSRIFNPSDYSTLCELDLRGYQSLMRIDILSFSVLSSIRLKSRYFTNPEGNHLCIALLCNPGGCPHLQKLHFDMGLEWDLLVLMLERRNFGLEVVKRIHTVTLPFIPSLIEKTLILLLAGEKIKRPPLELISLEATREVLFDPAVPGCCCCLKYMVPGCMEGVYQPDEDEVDESGLCLCTSEELYPEHEYQLNAVPNDIRDWMGYRANLVDAWKVSYDEFLQKFSRRERCYSRLWW